MKKKHNNMQEAVLNYLQNIGFFMKPFTKRPTFWPFWWVFLPNHAIKIRCFAASYIYTSPLFPKTCHTLSLLLGGYGELSLSEIHKFPYLEIRN